MNFDETCHKSNPAKAMSSKAYIVSSSTKLGLAIKGCSHLRNIQFDASSKNEINFENDDENSKTFKILFLSMLFDTVLNKKRFFRQLALVVRVVDTLGNEGALVFGIRDNLWTKK